MKQYFYHVTTEENAKKILKEGLIPQIGEHSSLAKERHPYVYASDLESVPYWTAILGMPVVLRFSAEMSGDIEINEYFAYCEFRFTHQIPAEDICVIKMDTKLPEKEMTDLALGYIDSISRICSSFAKYISYINSEEDHDFAEDNYFNAMDSIRLVKNVIQNLDFSGLQRNAALMRRNFHEAAKEEYTLCDVYAGARTSEQGLRLYELLSKKNCSLANDETDWICELPTACSR